MAVYNDKETLYDYIKKDNIPDGNHTLILYNNTSIDVEVYNYLTDIEYSANPVLGDNIPDTKMLILIYHKNLTIDSGVVLTPQVRKKGMLIFCFESITNNGNISMTARGSNAKGQNVYLIRNINNELEYVPAIGASGVTGAYPNNTAINGNPGINRATGSGGRGNVMANFYSGSGNLYLDKSGSGSSYSGGGGTGSASAANGGATSVGLSADCNGGNGYTYDQGNVQYFCGGGAGVIPGNSSYWNISSSYGDNKGMVGTGGLLIIYCTKLINKGIIESNGSNGAGIPSINFSGLYNGFLGGSGSGGGSVNIFYNILNNTGIINAKGGKGGTATVTNANMWYFPGADGGNGCVTLSKFQLFLIKDNLLKEYIINNTLAIINQNEFVNDDFNNYGMNNLSQINSNAISKVINQNYNIALLK